MLLQAKTDILVGWSGKLPEDGGKCGAFGLTMGIAGNF